MAKVKKKTKAEELQEAVAEAVGAGTEWHLESVDFSDPNRHKTCLEVDFPILPINHVSTIEGNAGKPIYQMSKWWARRRSSVFRAMLIAAATKAPDDSAEAAKLVWSSYYGNHQENEAFQKLKVADIFMGGGTTVVEGARLGMQMYGNDLNPVAWLVVKNEVTQVDRGEVKSLLDAIDAEVKPQVMPFFACECPRGHKGRWTRESTGEVMDGDFDPLSIEPSERSDFEYEGPEVLHTFWIKHGPCSAAGCGHRTPILSTPVLAIKTLSTRVWPARQCSNCGESFDIEQKEVRMAPTAHFVVADGEPPFAVMDDEGHYVCPHCHVECHDEVAANTGKSARLGKSQNKRISLSLLIHPDWIQGSAGSDDNGEPFGGSITDAPHRTAAWYIERTKGLQLIEVRGTLPKTVTLSGTSKVFHTDSVGGTVPKKSHFACASCGAANDVLKALTSYGKSGPITPTVVQGYCPQCDTEKRPYGGRFFDTLSLPDSLSMAEEEWQRRRDADLAGYWPDTQLPEGFKTTYQRIPEHGYPRFLDIFNPRQLLVHSQLLRAIITLGDFDWHTREFVLGAFQQFLRNDCMFSFWHRSHDHFAPALSNNNYHPKSILVEVGAFTPVGYGPWPSTLGSLIDSAKWISTPWEIVWNEGIASSHPNLANGLKTKGTKVPTSDPPNGSPILRCGTASALSDWESASCDLVVTDPPFGNNIQYSELADFFHVWLRLVLKDRYDCYQMETTPKSIEAVVNPVRNPDDPEAFYQRLLTECWGESGRILKPGGILAFTFHHSEDEPWVAVLESLFEAGFYLEAAYPIRSDETKGEGAKPGTFGSQLIEYDIVHVCRKRVEEPQPISWARLRRQIMRDVRQLQDILEQHEKAGLGEADLHVIRRGKALEYFSRHYGKVYIEKGREDDFTVKDALVGINQLLDDESDTTNEAPPVLAEPYTRQFLRLFADRSELARDQLQKYLRGTGVSPSEFLERGWCREEKKVFYVTSPLEWAQNWKGQPRSRMARDFDQSFFLVGACYDNSGIKISDTLNSNGFVAHPAIGDLLDWFSRHGSDDEMKTAASLAKQLYKSWEVKNKPKVEEQRTLFDLEED